MTIKLRLIIFLIILVAGLAGCLESSFQLSEQSRLPRWFSISQGEDRNDYTVKMDLYSTFSGGKDIFKLYKKGKLISVGKYVITTDDQPSIQSVQLSRQPEGFPKGYPRYKVVTINGITDIIELRKMEPLFYMTDDPAVWEELGVKQQ
jgi:hypothetical protein